MKYSQLKDKVVIITGGTSGIGLSLAKEFASFGTKTVIASIDKDYLIPLQNKFTKEGKECLSVYADVTVSMF